MMVIYSVAVTINKSNQICHFTEHPDKMSPTTNMTVIAVVKKWQPKQTKPVNIALVTKTIAMTRTADFFMYGQFSILGERLL